jgi:hypothetical protein
MIDVTDEFRERVRLTFLKDLQEFLPSGYPNHLRVQQHR